MKIKMRKNKRLWSDLILAACLLLLCIYLACGGFGMINRADAEESDPYDWSDYDGQVILDDPEFFMFSDEEEATEQSESEEQQETNGQETETEQTETPAEQTSQSVNFIS